MGNKGTKEKVDQLLQLAGKFPIYFFIVADLYTTAAA